MSLETGSGSHTTIVINLTAENGNTWASSAAVLTPDSKGFEAMADGGENNKQDGGFYSATPLPAALPMFAGGLGFVGFLARRKKRKTTIA